MAGVDEMMQQMRRMQDDMNRVMMRSSRDPFAMSLLDRSDPFFPTSSPLCTNLALPSSTSSSGALALPHVSMPVDAFKPSMDVIDLGDSICVHCDLPGMQKQDVKVDVKDGVLSIIAEHKEDKKRSEGNWVVQERKFGKFQRTLRLPENVKEDGIKAKFNEGVLELDLPKAEKTTGGKSIAIQ